MSIANWFGEDKQPFPPFTNVNAENVECQSVGLRDGSGGTIDIRGTEVSSPWVNAKLPSVSIGGYTHPLSVCRTSVFVNDTTFVVPSGTSDVFELGQMKINQMGLIFPSADIVEAPPDIENNFVELYLNVKVSTGSNANIATDISGVDSSFFETIGSMTSAKSGTYNVVFGIHLVPPDAFQAGNQYKFQIDNFGNQSITIDKITTCIKSLVL